MKVSASLILLLVAIATVQSTRLPSYEQKTKMVKFYSNLKLMIGCYGKPTIARWMQKSQEKYGDCCQQIKDKTATESATETAAAEAAVTGDVFFSAKKINYIKKGLHKSVDIARCYLEKFNMTITPEGTVDARFMKDHLTEQVENADLKQFVVSGIEKCEKKTGYGEYYNILGAENAELMKKIKFFRCAKAAKLKACIKFDLNQNQDMFDLSPLADAPTEFDDTKKMMIVLANYATSDSIGLMDY